MNNFFVQIFTLLVLTISAVGVISGQATTGAIRGTIADSHGAVVPGANVTLKLKMNNKAAEPLRQVTTDSEGKYGFSNIGIGEYEISVKVNWTDKVFRKAVKVSSSAMQVNIAISLEPCSEEEGAVIRDKIMDIDRAEIVRELINQLLRTKGEKVKIILSKDNLSQDWLTADQKEIIDLMTRSEIQNRTEKTGELDYFTVSKMTQRGNCVGVSLFNNFTVKGQLEDANMAGGGTTHEFRKVNGRWVGTVIITWIS
jgi:hypothetical protein